jgi:hypothetical protein
MYLDRKSGGSGQKSGGMQEKSASSREGYRKSDFSVRVNAPPEKAELWNLPSLPLPGNKKLKRRKK